MKDLVKNTVDLRSLSWTESVNTSGTGGTFLKSKRETARECYYYKMSCYDSYRGVYGHECVNELITSRLMQVLGIPHLTYNLLHAQVALEGVKFTTWLNMSKSYRLPGEKKQSFDLFYDLHKQPNERPLDFAERYGWREQIEQMFVTDYLCVNRDRHGANIEVLRNNNGALRLAPIFDTGLSFVFSSYGDDAKIASFDPLNDVNCNNFIGTRSLKENLNFIQNPVAINPLKDGSKDVILEGLEGVLNKAHLEIIWEIITTRYDELMRLRLVQPRRPK
jgi:hypothetical protein